MCITNRSAYNTVIGILTVFKLSILFNLPTVLVVLHMNHNVFECVYCDIASLQWHFRSRVRRQTNSLPSSAEIAETIDVHNDYRRIPRASNMREMVNKTHSVM